MPKTFEDRINFLQEPYRSFAQQDEDTRLDIIEHDLDREEIEYLVGLNYHLEHETAKKKITVLLSEHVLQGLKIRAKHLDMPYQTLMNSVLHQWVMGEL